MARLLLLIETYGDYELCITDLDNEQLQKILEKAIENDENGIGKGVDELCDELFGYDYYLRKIDSSDSHSDLKDLDNLNCIADCEYYVFAEILNQ